MGKSWVALGIGIVVIAAAAAYFLVIAPGSRPDQAQAQTTTTAPATVPASPPATTQTTQDQGATGQAPASTSAPAAAPSTQAPATTSTNAPASSQPTQSTGSTTAPSATSSDSTSAPAATPPAASSQPVIGPDEHVLGKADAPVTIIEYASLTCPHCAEFHNDTLPKVKSEFVEKGLARLVFRPFPLDRLALSASLLAQCAPGDGYFSMLAILFRSQQTWEHADDPVAALKQIGRTAGMNEDAIDKCLADKSVIDKIVAGMKDAQEIFKVDATPTFIINGKSYPGALPFDDYDEEGATKPGFGKIVRDLLPKS